MSAKTINRIPKTEAIDRLVPVMAAKIREANEAWQRGEMTSPSELDYVIDGDELLGRVLPDYIGSTPEGRDFIADELFEDAGKTWVEDVEVARAILERLMGDMDETVAEPVLTTAKSCVTCGGEVTSRNPELYPYCRGCHYTGRAEGHIRSAQVARFQAAFPDAVVGIDHTGGGCFWLSIRWDGESTYYALTDGEAGLPTYNAATDPEAEDWRPIPNGGWGFVGRFSEDEESDDFEGTPLYECEPATRIGEGLTDEQAIEKVRDALGARVSTSADEVTVELQAMEPRALFDAPEGHLPMPEGVFIHVGRVEHPGVAVTVKGPRAKVVEFIEHHWGAEEVKSLVEYGAL
jgi:hypothetical protein